MRNKTVIIIFDIHNDECICPGETTDSTFINNSRPIVFVVNRTDISESDKDWINNFLIPELEALGDRDIILGRATASPEGSTPNNVRLARSRKASMDALLGRYGINTKRIRYDVVPEDYPLLLSLMQMEHDKYLPTVKTIIRKHDGKGDQLKAELKRLEGGKSGIICSRNISHSCVPSESCR